MSEIVKPFDVPDHWTWATFEEIGVWSGGGTPSKRKSIYWDGEIPWVSPKDVKTLAIRDTEDHVTPTAVQESSAKHIPSGSILFVTRSGILQHTLPTAVATVDVTVNQDLKALTPIPSVDSRFVLYYTQAANQNILQACSKNGTTVQSIESSKLYQYPLPVPPLSEQYHIVAKIEELLSNLNAGVTELKTAQRHIERYRLSVLQAAVEGRLTAVWRRTYNPEPVDQLLEKILEERRKQWEENYRAKYEAKGKEPPTGWKSRYPKPDDPDTADLPDLPDGWIWTNIENACIVYGGVTKNARKGGDLVEMPYLRVANVYANDLRLDDIKQIKVKRNRLNKYLLKEGDLLVVEGNGSKSQIGRVARWDGSIDPCVHQNHLIKVRPMIQETGRYLLWWMLSPNGRRYITNVASSTSGLYTLSMTKVRSIPVPLPPLAEQKQMVAEVERLLSVADDTAQTVERELKRSSLLRKRIFRDALQGSLVSHSQYSGPLHKQLNIEKTELRELLHAERHSLKQEIESEPDESHYEQMDLFQQAIVPNSGSQTRKTEGTRLGDIILNAGQPLVPKELFERSNIEDIDTFYELLKKEVEAGIISEKAPDSNTRLLNVTDED